MQQIETKRIPLSKMNPAPYNPRIKLSPGDPEYDSLNLCMEEYGCVVPIVWNEISGNIISGHRRYDVLLAHGESEAEAVVVNIKDMNREKALNLALNNIRGRWDEELLLPLLAELQNKVDLAVAGFSIEEVNKLLDSIPEQDFIADLLGEDFVSPDKNPAYFQVTFMFESQHKEKVEGYIRERGKEGLTALILSHIEEAE